MRTGDRKKHVLLADDSRLAREFAGMVLEEAGCTYSVAENGRQALSMLGQEKFDLVLLDIEMPQLSGIQVTQQLRAEGRTIPVIALTGHDTDAERKKCLDAGMNACLTKPFTKEQLTSTMIALLDVFEPALETALVPPPELKPKDRVTDLAHLMQLTKGRKEFFMSMIAIFLEQNREDMNGLEAAIRKADYEAIQLLSHKIATSVTFMGLESHVVPQLKEMEQLGEEKKNNMRISVLYHQVAAVCAKAEEELIAVQQKEQVK